MRKTIVVDPKKCYACLSCVVECSYRRAGAAPDEPLNATNFSQAGCDVQPVRRSRLSSEAMAKEDGEGGAVEFEPVPLFCHHCEDAPCMAVCPSAAIHRESEEGPVLLDAERCIGCKACVMACPFGMIRPTPDNKVLIKCDLCADRLARGLAPACVSACPAHAIEFKELDEIIIETRKRAAAALRSGK